MNWRLADALPHSLLRWLPLIIFLAFYALTTVAGAVYFMAPDGTQVLRGFLGYLDPRAAAEIGSGKYLVLLFLPFLIAPPAAWVGMRLADALARRLPLTPTVLEPTTSRRVLVAMSLLAGGYCLLLLHQQNALLINALAGATYKENILRRTDLFDALGPAFFIVAWGFVPMLSAIFLALFVKNGHRLADLAGFVLTFLLFYFLVFSVYTKSHLIVFAIMLSGAIILARASLWYIPGLAALSVAAFLSMEVLLSGVDSGETSTTPQQEEAGEVGSYLAYYVLKAAPLRMASAFPFYLAIFEDPAERCGIEANTVRRVLGFPASNCSLPTKVFPVMYPEIDWVTGYSPAPVHVSAYGEIGLWWSFVVTALSGLLLGVFGTIATLGKGPLYVGFGVAACTFGYYLSQLPIVATFTYGHGLIFLSLPVLVLLLAQPLANRSRKEMVPPDGLEPPTP